MHEEIGGTCLKICIVGAGALGSTMAGALARSGAEVWLIGRNLAHIEAINAHGLEMVEDGVSSFVPVQARLRAAGIGTADLVIILVKSFDTRNAIEAARPLLGAETLVLSLQNGLGHEEILASVAGRGQVLGGKTYVGGVLLGPGRVRAGISGKETVIGELDGDISPRVQGVAAGLNEGGLLTQISPNIMGTMWDKLLVNIAGGALTAITHLTYGGLYSLPELEEAALAAIGEAMNVASAHGVELITTDPRQAWDKARTGLPPEFKTSMLQSLEMGQKTEIDFIHGAVLHWGRAIGIPTPVNATLVACVKGIEYATTDYPGKA